MIATSAMRNQGKKSQARQCEGRDDETKPTSGPENHPANDFRSTVRVANLPTVDDVSRAAQHILRDWSSARVERAVERLAKTFPAIDLNALGLPPKRSPWPIVGALLVHLAGQRGDAELFWRAGHVVLDAYRQSQRASAPRELDALSRQILDFIRAQPDATGAECFERWTEIGFTGVVIDAFGDVLTYEDDDGVPRDIGREAFCRRYRRLAERRGR